MNQGEENKSVNSEKKYENFLRDEIVVHTMPKSFRKMDFSGGKHMSTGIFVMIGGLILLLGLGSLSYYLVVKKDFFSLDKKNDLVVQEEKPIAVKKEKTETNPATTTDSIINATSTEAITDMATSTIDNLIEDFNQDLASSSLSTFSESVASNSDSLIINGSQNSSTTEVVASGNDAAVTKEVVDTDQDALSDLEEVILGTDPNKMDTDGDGYSDFQELDRMYDPAGKGNLASNKAITSYANPTHHYSLIYPAVWMPSNYDKDDSIMFKIDSSQFVQIIVQANPDKQTIDDFYKKIANVNMIDESQKVTEKAGWGGVVSKDGLFYYLKKDGVDDIYVIAYTLGINNTPNFKKLFEMMVNSLDIASL